MKYNKHAFTLIELLVVVLIIGILTAMAVPMYEKATRKAQFVQIQTTLSALMRDIDTYVMENGYSGNYSSSSFTMLFDSVNCNLFSDGNNWFCGTDQGTYWLSGSNSNLHLSFWPSDKLFVNSQKGTFSFTKSIGKPWTWTNDGNMWIGAKKAEYSETFQMFCDWWIKMGGKPVSGTAKTVADTSCAN